MRLLKVLVALILLGIIALAGYAYFGDMEPAQTEIRVPLNGPQAPVAETPTAEAGANGTAGD